MKKTTIIAICVVYLLSILAVQFFGVPVTVPEAGEYITSIEIVDVSLSNRQVGQDTSIEEKQNTNGKVFVFHFIEAEEGKEYTLDEESLAANPNRLKISYKLLPEGVGQGALKLISSNSNVKVLPQTEQAKQECCYELVFLNDDFSIITIKEDKASVSVSTQFTVVAI